MFAEKQNGPNNSGPVSPNYIQRKLEVGPKDDPQEKEADAVASQVMRMSENDTVPPDEKLNGKQQESPMARLLRRHPDAPRPAVIHRFADAPKAPVVKRSRDIGTATPGPVLPIRRKKDEEEVMRNHDLSEEDKVMKMDDGGKGGPAPAAVEQGIQSSKGQGNPLPKNVQQDIGGKMGADLSDVRIHTGSNAHEMSTAINAKAFTHGQDVYFRNGNYDTSGSAGKKLLTHELMHTQQQKKAGDVNRKVQRNWLWERMKGQAKKSLRVLPDWLQFYIAYNIGTAAGIIDWVKDLLVLAWNTSIVKIVYDLIWGDLIQDIKDMGKMLKELTWDQFKEIMSEIGRQIVGDVEAYWARMTSSDPQTSGYAWGWIVGYLVPEVVLLVLTDGIATGAKWGAKVLQWMGRLGTKILKYGPKGARLARKGVAKGWKGVKKGWKKVTKFSTSKRKKPLTSSQLKSIRTLEKRIEEHKKKLADFIKDPMKYDNQGFLKNAPNDAVRQKIIESRIKHLQHEIKTFQDNIQKILDS